MSGFCASHILYVCAQKPDKPRHLLQPWQARQDYFWDSVCLQGYINHYWSLSGKNVGVLIRTALSSCWQWLCNLSANHRRRIYTENKAKVVAAVWGTEFIEFLATLAILHQDDMKKRINCTRMIWRKGWISPGLYEESMNQDDVKKRILFFKSPWCKIASGARNWIKSVPKQQRRPLPSLPSPMQPTMQYKYDNK